MLGTPAWCLLAHDDLPQMGCTARRRASTTPLRIETAQEARAEASHAIEAAEDWPATAQRIPPHY